jgi:aspartate/methionine/tyrosine aminotransferase
MHPVYAKLQVSFFELMSARARERGAINLGQGFPDGAGPPAVLAAAGAALTDRSNQYPPMPGLPELRAAVADHYRAAQGLDLGAGEVVITSGATEALAAAILALVSPGDEVLMFQPLYDAYWPLVERAGGTPRPIRLTPPDWRITRAALDEAATPATRLVILCNPLNPTGSVATEEELATLATFCVERDLIAICDEVWEHVLFDGARHRPLMNFPGMPERSVKIGSAGKIFALTGWKIGWMCAAPALTQVLMRAHQFLTFTTPPNLQWAVAEGLRGQMDWVEQSRSGFQRSRDRLAAGLERLGLRTLPSQATWFIALDLAASGIALDDAAFCDWMVDEAGVAGLPISAFYVEEPVTHLVRLCFAKEDATLDEALARLERALPHLPR